MTSKLRGLSIGSVQLDFPVVQAALSGYSDMPMRVIARRLGAPYTLCEVMLDKFIVALKPRIGAYVVAAWLVGIIFNLLLLGHGYDIALRDFGLCLGAIALGRLSETYDRGVRAK